MVPIFTYRDERKLFSLVATIIVVSLIALAQMDSARSGRSSFLSNIVSTVFMPIGRVITGTVSGIGGLGHNIASLPALASENATISARLTSLSRENDELREQLAKRKIDARFIEPVRAHPTGIEANVIGFDPENTSRMVTIDRGTLSGVRRDAGVISDDGVVGRVIDAGPIESRVVLVTDFTSNIPAIVQRGRWWAIARGTMTSVQLEYVAQDAPLRIGEPVVTGNGRSFAAGIPLGRISRIVHSEGALYQTAIVTPAVDVNRLERVIVLQK